MSLAPANPHQCPGSTGRAHHCDRCDSPGGVVTLANQACLPIRGRMVCIDWCIHHIVAALNAAGIATVASCCGHGKQPGRIDLADGRVLSITGRAAPLPLACLDCGKPYSTFRLDTTIPDEQWRAIHESEGGVLCANCMVARLAKLPGAIAVRAYLETAEEPRE